MLVLDDILLKYEKLLNFFGINCTLMVSYDNYLSDDINYEVRYKLVEAL